MQPENPPATDAPTRRDRRRAGQKPRRRVSVFGVIGELFITAGAVILLFVAWQLWVGDLIYADQRNEAGSELSQQWSQDYSADAIDVPEPTADPESSDETSVEPVILAEPADAEVFGVMHIPRFGDDYAVEIAGGVTREGTLDPIGIGHYPGSEMPGEVGNFALAAHRTTYGKPFNLIANLQVGDAIVVETQDGWYTYRFRTLEYVTPDRVDVLLDVPQEPDVPAGDRYMTMTSCSPMYSMDERIVAYSVFEGFTPRADGEPASLTEGAA